MYCACTPTLMGVAIPVSEILLLFKKKFQISLSDHGLLSMVIKKFKHLESAQKVLASRG